MDEELHRMGNPLALTLFLENGSRVPLSFTEPDHERYLEPRFESLSSALGVPFRDPKVRGYLQLPPGPISRDTPLEIMPWPEVITEARKQSVVWGAAWGAGLLIGAFALLLVGVIYLALTT